MSVPNVAHLDPQRGGCCTVMPYFVGDVLELPLTTTQDYSLFHILNDYSLDLWQRQLRLVSERHGLASFIVHPDYVVDARARGTYRALLAHLAQLRADGALWIPLPREVDQWGRERSEMTVVAHGAGWRIEGNGSERARLAFASLDRDRVVFTIEEPVCRDPGGSFWGRRDSVLEPRGHHPPRRPLASRQSRPSTRCDACRS
jgi:hypothetical protein